MDHGDWLAAFIDKEVIAECSEGWTIFGTITAISAQHIEFSEVDLHNQSEANSTRDMYAIENRSLGIRANRRQLFVPRERLLSLCRLVDVIG